MFIEEMRNNIFCFFLRSLFIACNAVFRRFWELYLFVIDLIFVFELLLLLVEIV